MPTYGCTWLSINIDKQEQVLEGPVKAINAKNSGGSNVTVMDLPFKYQSIGCPYS
jgi:hypothetical protein